MINNNFRCQEDAIHPIPQKYEDFRKEQMISSLWREMREIPSLEEYEPEIYQELPEWKYQSTPFIQQLYDPYPKETSTKSIYTRATSIDSDSCFNNPTSNSIFSSVTNTTDTMNVGAATNSQSLLQKSKYLQDSHNHQINDQYPHTLHQNAPSCCSSYFDKNNIQGQYYEDRTRNFYSNQTYHPPSCPQIDPRESQDCFGIDYEKYRSGFGSEGHLGFAKIYEGQTCEIKDQQFEPKQSENSNMNSFFEKDPNPQSICMIQQQNHLISMDMQVNQGQVRIGQTSGSEHFRDQNGFQIARDDTGFINHSDQSQFILQKEQYNPSLEQLQKLPTVVPSIPILTLQVEREYYDHSVYENNSNIEFHAYQQQQQFVNRVSKLSLSDVNQITINDSYARQEYLDNKREHISQQLESSNSIQQPFAPTFRSSDQLYLDSISDDSSNRNASVYELQPQHRYSVLSNSAFEVPLSTEVKMNNNETTPTSLTSLSFEKPKVWKTRQKAMSVPAFSNSSSVKKLIRKFSHEQQYQQYQENNSYPSLEYLKASMSKDTSTGNTIDESNEDGSLQAVEENYDSEELSIEELTSNKKNVVKNIMNAFKMFILSWGSKTEITDIYNDSAKGAEEEIEDIQRKFKRYIGLKSFNHYSLRLLILHQLYGPLFKHFLSNHSIKWLENSKIKDVECHQKMIYFFLTCFEDIKTIDILRRHPKKKARFS